MIAVAIALSVVGLAAVSGIWDIYRRRMNAVERQTDVLSEFQQKLTGMAETIDEIQLWKKSVETIQAARGMVVRRPS